MNKKVLITAAGVGAVLLVWMLASKPKEDTVGQRINQSTASAAEQINSTPKTTNPSSSSAAELYQQALKAKGDRDLVKAKDAYRELFINHPDFEQIDQIQQELENLNLELIFSNVPTKNTTTHEVKGGDTLGKLAKKYGTTIELIKTKNHLKSDVIRIGQKLVIWTEKFNIHVDKSQNILILKTNNEVVKVYRVSTGKNNSTPVGEFKITTKLVDPVWFHQGAVVPPESPSNVLGSRWLGFDIPGYGIHGTTAPESIGKQATAGCVRMRNAEVEELYSMIPMGTMVSVVD